MTLQEYSEKAHTTAIYPNIGNNLPYTVLGLIEETCEFMEKYGQDAGALELLKEAGDIYWYANETAITVQQPIYTIEGNYIFNGQIEREDITKAIQVLAGKTKKFIRDDNNVLPEDKRESIVCAIDIILDYIDSIMLDDFDIKQSEILQINIDKLFSRKERGVLGGSGDNR